MPSRSEAAHLFIDFYEEADKTHGLTHGQKIGEALGRLVTHYFPVHDISYLPLDEALLARRGNCMTKTALAAYVGSAIPGCSVSPQLMRTAHYKGEDTPKLSYHADFIVRAPGGELVQTDSYLRECMTRPFAQWDEATQRFMDMGAFAPDAEGVFEQTIREASYEHAVGVYSGQTGFNRYMERIELISAQKQGAGAKTGYTRD